MVVSIRTAIFINSVINWALANHEYDRDELKAFQDKLRAEVKSAKFIDEISQGEGFNCLVSISDEDKCLVESVLKSFKERNRGSNS